MRKDIEQILAKKGYTEVFYSIVKSIRDLKYAGYSKQETKETLLSIYSDGEKIDRFIENQLNDIF